MLTKPRSVCVVLAAMAWAATAAAVIAGGDLGRGAAVQIVLAASMATAALSDALLSPALSARAIGRHSWPGAIAVIALLAGPAAGAAFGAGWRTSLFTTVALAFAAASIVAYRPGLLRRGARRTGARAAATDPGQLQGRDPASTRHFVAM